MAARRIIVGISGASGFVYGLRALELLRPLDVEVHLVMSRGADKTLAAETDVPRAAVEALAEAVHAVDDLGGSIASGSFDVDGMLIAPCSMRTLAAVAHALSDNLLTRAADVALKERRCLVMMVRETPLNLAHIANMRKVTEMGAVVMPPVPAFYLRPQTVDDIVTHSVGRALSILGIEIASQPRWAPEGRHA